MNSRELQPQIERLIEFFGQHGIDYQKFDPNSSSSLDFGKRHAYPNHESLLSMPGQHDTHKWLQAISDIYRKERNGENRVQAIRSITSGWNIMETFDFLNWVKFYESGDHMKYKFAQLWYENPDIPGYALHIKKDPEPEKVKNVSGPDIDFAAQRATEDHDRRERIEKQRNKIIGRLDSAEKLLRSPEGHLFSGKEFETLLESIYQLKKKIQMVNKISTSTRLYEDMIVREANILSKYGFVKAANVLYSVAQSPAQNGEQAQGSPNGAADLSSAPPTDPSGAGNPGPPSGGAATPAQPPGGSDMPQSEPNAPPGIQEFLERLDGTNMSDKQGVEDDLEVKDTDEVLEVNDEVFVTEAQMAPVTEPLTTSPAPAPLDPSPVTAPEEKADKIPATKGPATEEPLEVTEDDIGAPKGGENAPPSAASDFDKRVDAVFSNISVADVVAKLEDLAKVFKVREIPRQLGIIDMMLDSLGLASYFPSLSEATNKALESNNYISTRVEDILSKLRGAISTREVDLKGGGEVEKPEVAGIKNKLKSDEDKEKQRKQMRKEQEAAELAGAGPGKETPEVEVAEDLAPPDRPATPPTA